MDVAASTQNELSPVVTDGSLGTGRAMRSTDPGENLRPLLRVWQILAGARRRSQGFALFTLLAAVAAQLLVFLIVNADPTVAGSTFISEIRVLSLVGAAISVGVFLAPSRRSFWAVMVFRVLTLMGFLGAARHGTVVLHLLMLMPVLMELATYERLLVAVTGDVIVVIGSVVFALAPPSVHEPIYVVTAAAGSAFVAALYGLTKFYREALVDYSKRVVNLQGAFEQLTDSNLGLQIYATNAENESATKERTRITRELHDSVGYALTNIDMMMKAARVLMHRDPQKLETILFQAQEMANHALADARSILYKLRRVDDQSYQGLWAISRLVKAYRLATGVDVEVHYGNVEWSLGHDIDAAIYRLVQEGLTNAYRHGGAEKVRITMWMTNDEMIAQIWDNGRGASVVHEGIGLAGMRERFVELGGRIEANNTADGFEVTGRISWKTRGDGATNPHTHSR